MASTDMGTGAATGAAIMAFTYGGITVEHFLLGMGCYVVGSACRFGTKVGTAMEGNQPISIGRALVAFSVSPLLGAFASMVMFLGSHILGFEGEAGIGIILLIAGWKGPEGIQWLVGIVTKAMPEKFGGDPKPEKKP